MYGMILQGMVATRLLEERRAEAAQARLVAELARGAKPDPRGATGRLLIRAGKRLTGTPVVARGIPSHAA